MGAAFKLGLSGSSAGGVTADSEWLGMQSTESFLIFSINSYVIETLHLAYSKLF